MIKSRFMNHTATFYRKVTVRDEAGEENQEWKFSARSFVDIRPLSVDKEDEVDTSYQISRLELSTRFSRTLDAEIKTGDSVMIKNKRYIIESIGDLFSRKKLSYIIYLYE